MPDFAEPLARLIAEFKRLPGIGQKSAQRLAFHVLRAGREDAEHLAQQAAEDNDCQCDEEQVDPDGLPLWLPAPERACEKKPARDVGGCDPEDRKLQMPGPQQVGRKDRSQIEAVKRARLGPVVGGCPSHEHLGEKEKPHHHKVFYRCLLTVGGPTRNHSRVDVLSSALPAQVVEPAEGEENERCSPEEGDKA